jgi:ABC-type sugar transport system substrate-binding protein
VDAFGAADRIRAGAAEGGFILRDECISRVIKFDSKQTKTEQYILLKLKRIYWLKRTLKNFGGTEWRGARKRQRQKKFVVVVVGALEDSEVSSQDQQVATSILTALGETQAVHGQPRRAALFIVTRRDCLIVGTRAFVNR